MIVARSPDDFEPARIIALQLHETAGNRPLAARRRDVGVAALIRGRDMVAEGVETVGHGVAPLADREARGVVDVDAIGVEQIAAPVADAAGDVVSRIEQRADSAAGGDAVVVGLDLVVVGPVAVECRVPVEQIVAGLVVAPVHGSRVVPDMGIIDR